MPLKYRTYTFWCIECNVLIFVGLAAELKKKLKSYTALRKQREEFRQRLVKLITSVREDEMDIDDIPNAQEKEMLRYYYYVKHGVDTVHVAPLDEKVLNRVRHYGGKLYIFKIIGTKYTYKRPGVVRVVF